MNRLLITILILFLAAAMGCKSEIDNKTAAEVEEVTPEAESDEAATAEPENAETPTTVAFDESASKIEWVGAKVTRDHDGGFKGLTGNVVYDGEGKVTRVETEIDTRTVWSDTEKLTKHLKSDDFFDVEKFPTATFESTEIVPAEEPDTFKVSGVLNLRGVEKQISFPATIKTEGTNVVTDAEFTLKRFDWGIVYKGKADDLIKEEVLMKLHIVAPQPERS